MTQKTLDSLNEIYAICKSPDWDGYDALPVEQETLAAACEFVESCPRGVPQPEIGAEPDGQITLEWRKSSGWIISVSVGHDRKLSFAGKFGNRGSLGTMQFKKKFPRCLLGLFRELFPKIDLPIATPTKEKFIPFDAVAFLEGLRQEKTSAKETLPQPETSRENIVTFVTGPIFLWQK